MRGGQPCDKCGQGSGMGQMGRGRGGLAKTQETDVAFKTERGKVHTGKGAIVGQFLVDGEQVKGEAKTNLVEVVSAAEREASDRINRDRIPRQYHKAVKAYFSNIQRSMKGSKPREPGGKPAKTDEPPAADRPTATPSEKDPD
jgi:hypothetical protein